MASSLLLAFFSAVVLVEASLLLDVPETRIVGGHEIQIEDAPWQVSLQYLSGHTCGGSIISSEWIVSAAHCTTGLNMSLLEILVGTNSLKEGGTKYSVDVVVVHERYDENNYMNDICLLRTKAAMELVLPVKAVTLPGPDATWPPVETKLRVSGWGSMENGTYPTVLRAVDVSVLDSKDCGFNGDRTRICVGPIDRGHFSGDSGGPLVKGDLLVGVVSGRLVNGTVEHIALRFYTYVAAYRGWIKTHTGL